LTWRGSRVRIPFGPLFHSFSISLTYVCCCDQSTKTKELKELKTLKACIEALDYIDKVEEIYPDKSPFEEWRDFISELSTRFPDA